MEHLMIEMYAYVLSIVFLGVFVIAGVALTNHR